MVRGEARLNPKPQISEKLMPEWTVDRLITFSLLLYLPFHLLEEWAFGFAAWAELHWRIPNYTTAKWLVHNVYFTTFLIIGYLIYRSSNRRRLTLGVGLIFWGLTNAANHLICSIIFRSYEPGIVTGLLWIPLAVAAFRILRETGQLSAKLLWSSFLVSILVNWAMPMILFIKIDKLLGL